MQNQMPTEDSDQEETSDDEQHDAPRVAQWVGEDELDDEDLPLDEMGNEAERSDLVCSGHLFYSYSSSF